MAIIRLENITYKYPLSDKPCLNDISLELEAGKFYGLIGENGSGKTSLCNLIRGFIPHFFQGELTGTAEVFGKDIREYSLGELALKIGYIFQNPFNQISGVKDNVYEEVAYGLENFGVERDEIIRRVDEVLELTGIEHLKDKNPFELSGGQQQRVALASVIILKPEILVIDEPTSQLDPVGTELVFEIIKKMKEEGKTVILVEHKMELVAEYADEIIVLENNKLYKSGDKQEIFKEADLETHGVRIPELAKLGLLLKDRGVDMASMPMTIDDAVCQIRSLMEGGR